MDSYKTGKTLPLMEAFQTVQGEGYHQGKAAYFIRLGGCDVGCHWCDVKESWDASEHQPTSIQQIINPIPNKLKMVVVTGGEPLMWDLNPLTKALKSRGKRVHLETSGAYPVSGSWDWFCLSPKKRKSPVTKAYELADELKVVIYNQSDFQFAIEQSRKVFSGCLLFLQPEWSKKNQMMPMIVDFVKKNPQWMVSLQIHKYLEIP
ncbi:MAG: 7-carboxy-7-deazaguanine synthase QueE [Flavobacteriaceae bacterium]|nr:7-carboxy-7-deazaguanine synthase QueE [Flavobacteriaceae bacterium]